MVPSEDQLDYVLSFKYGYLHKKSKVWYKSWVERFYVLTNIGLVYMESPHDKEIKLCPYNDFQVHEVPKNVYNRDWVLRISTK